MPTHEVFMAFRKPVLCEHATSNGGDERQHHRGANGHTRHISCKDCDNTIACARRKELLQHRHTWFRLQSAPSVEPMQGQDLFCSFLDRLKRTPTLHDAGYPAASPTSSASPTSPGALTAKSTRSSKLSTARPKNAGKNRRKTDDGWDVSLTDPRQASQALRPHKPRSCTFPTMRHGCMAFAFAWKKSFHLFLNLMLAV